MIARCRRAATKLAPLLHWRLLLPVSRFYSTAGAAQPELDPDYYHYGQYNDSDSCEPSGTTSMALADAGTLVPVRGVQWAFIGSPCTKKHVFAEILSKFLEVPHIYMATLVRQDLHPRSSLYKQIATAVNCGELVPEDIIFKLLSKRLEDGYNSGEMGFILDGIPRSRFQAEILDQLAEIDLVVNFKPTGDFLVKNGKEHTRKDDVKAYTQQVIILFIKYSTEIVVELFLYIQLDILYLLSKFHTLLQLGNHKFKSWN
uniref:adenylate kinase n=1 Tax=Rhizophora mucronata TaxID=61149 RepID=A0A2P2KIW6_RHIMU